MTIHKAQGLTCDTAFVYATGDLYRELGYVALSRGRDLNVIYTTGDVKIDPEAHIRTPRRVPSEMLMRVCRRAARRSWRSTSPSVAEVSIERLSTPDLVAERQRLQAVLDAAPAVPSADYAHEVEYTWRTLVPQEARNRMACPGRHLSKPQRYCRSEPKEHPSTPGVLIVWIVGLLMRRTENNAQFVGRSKRLRGPVT